MSAKWSVWALRNRDTEAASSVRLGGKGLLLARAVCMAVLGSVLVIFIFSILAYVAYLHHVASSAADLYSGQLDAEGLQRLRSIGLSLDSYIAYQAGIKTLFVGVWLLVGAVIFWRKSDQPFALFVALTFMLFSISFGFWAQTALPSQWQGLLVGLNVVSGICISFLLPLFPDGHFVPRWSRWPFIIGTLYHEGFAALFPGIVSASPLLSVLDGIQFVSGLVFLAAIQIYRYRRVSSPAQRQQTKWAVSGFVVAMLGFASAILLGTGFGVSLLPGTPLFLFQQGLVYIALLFIPLSVGIAILRSHLWDIDLLINRVLVYGLLTACIVGLYMFVVAYLGTLFHSELNLVISLAAAGVVAVVFQPLRLFLQRSVNRLFYGLRDEPYTVLAGLSQRLKATVEPAAVLPTIVQDVREALKLSYAAIEVDNGDGPLLAAASGIPGTGEPISLPMVYQGKPAGTLLVSARDKGDSLSPSDLRLLENLADQIGTATHAVRMTADLQRMAADLQHSRESLVFAREEERRRLRRDLHDGVGPTLASLSQRLDVACRLVKRDPDAAIAMMEALKVQVKSTIADIRQLVYALRPPILDELGLVSAIQQQIMSLQEIDGLHISVEASTEMPELSAAVEVAAYRIILESVTNMQRHAQAKNGLVRLGLGEGEALYLSICDDGGGLPTGYQAGVGITSMRERVAELGGSFEINSQSGSGTCVQVRLPLKT